MDTGRISLPSIDTMLDTTPTLLHLEKVTSSIAANSHDYQSGPCPPQRYPSTPPSYSMESTWRSHSRSFSLDSPSNRPLSQTQVQPSHEGSATSILVSPPPSQHNKSSLSSSSSSKEERRDSWNTTDHPPRPSHHHHHHRRTLSTPYINTMATNTNSTLISLMDATQRKYICHQCNKSFSRPSSLRTHIFSHTGEKPFACPYQHCDRTFSVQSNMRRHIRVHYSASLAQPKHHTHA
ncbi:hypothetical protein [Absidia glauca]|uniref:C2H2-type domain-containing protein n=1 Tax=Absidia glauca TaxID=4829 RepID=A0A163J151_ABSGL|nr:hypothetical protein [Absidia glauca]